MSATVHAPSPSRPLVRIREAIGHCRHAGITVRIGPLGVIATSVHGRSPWELEPGAKSISPVGAAIIAWQPPPLDPQEAAALAIGCNVAMLEGIADGLEKADPAEGWLKTAAKASYREGYEAGTQLRVELLAPTGALRVIS